MAEAFKCDRCGNLIEGKSATSEPVMEEIEDFGVSIRIGRRMTEEELAKARQHPLAAALGLKVAQPEQPDDSAEADRPQFVAADFCRPCFNDLLVKALRLREMQAIGEQAL